MKRISEKIRDFGTRQKLVLTILITFCLFNISTDISLVRSQEAVFSYIVDTSLRPTEETVSGEPGEPERTIVVMMHPNGIMEEFVENEIVFEPSSEEELDELLAKYNARVLNDGEVPPPPADTQYDGLRQPFQSSGYHVIQVDLETVDLTDFVHNMEQLDFQGEFIFSSESAVKLTAILASEELAGRAISGNYLLIPQSPQCVISSTREHPITGGFQNAFDFGWLNDSQIQVTRAWQYIDLLGLSSATVPLAVVDRGFQVNQDFRGFPQIWGYDFEDGDYHDKVQSNDEGYHGTLAFSTAGALIDNNFGSAGTGGQVVVPLFFRAHLMSQIANAIYNAAVNWGAEVVTISRGSYGSFQCILKCALKHANNNDVIVLASAGNDENNLDTTNLYPCEGPWVIGVGAIDLSSKQAIRKSTHTWGSNYGSDVDIWAPGEGIDTTTTPGSKNNLTTFSGTSAATPYVAGIVALMKAINPNLNHDQALSILQDTANSNSDTRVKSGYLNAYDAVVEAASSLGIFSKGDNFEKNDSFAAAYPVAVGKDYVATIEPADSDYFRFILSDYMMDMKLSLRYNRGGSGNDLELEVYDGSEKLLKGYDNWLSSGELRHVEKTIKGPIITGYARVYGSTYDSINCYTLRISGGTVGTIKPDRYDDGLYPSGKPGEPRNDGLTSPAVIPGKIKGDNPFGMDSLDIKDLNFDTKGDIDFFTVQLDSAVSKYGDPECCSEVGPDTKQGQLEIRVCKQDLVRPFEIATYKSGQPKSMTGLSYILKCPHNDFPDGKVTFSVRDLKGRNSYNLILDYNRCYTDITPPDWMLDYEPPLFRRDVPPWMDHVQLMYPLDPEIIHQFFDDELTGPLPPEYLSFRLPEAGDYQLDIIFPNGGDLSVALLNEEGELLAEAAWMSPYKRLEVQDLQAGIYFLKVEGEKFGTYYVLNSPSKGGEDFSNVFFMSLSPGLNMVSLPLKPITLYNARSFAGMLSATVVIKFDAELRRFVGFTLGAPDDGFTIEGGKGYIVNTPEGGTVAFTGAAWRNEPPTEMPAPAQTNSAWAFVVSGSVLDGDGMSISNGDYTAIVKNLRTNDTLTEAVNPFGYFAAASADLTRKTIIASGDQVEVAVLDSSGNLVSGPHIHDVTLNDIRNAVVNVQLRLGDIIPAKSAMLQNYPNPFNPDTWIPYQLAEDVDVNIKIYDTSGRLIRPLNLGHKPAGFYTSKSKAAYWDGKNEAGEPVSSGVYFYTIQAGEFTATKKMIVAR